MPPNPPSSHRRRPLIAITAGVLVVAGTGAVIASGAVPVWLALGSGFLLACLTMWIGLMVCRPAALTTPSPPPAAVPTTAAAMTMLAPPAPPRPPEPPATPALPPARNPPTATIRHVLVVDDNAVNQLVELELLRHLGFSVSVATNGKDALEHIERTADLGGFPALVLMDCQMPVMDGFAATRAWRQRERDGHGIGHLPIVAVTANALTVTLAQCEMAGMDGLLIKPLTTERVIAAIHHVLPEWTPGATVARTCSPDAIERLRASTTNPNFIREVITIFLTDADLQMRVLTTVAAQGDAPALARAAHKLKGASLAVGLEAVAGLCGRIDELAEAGRIDEAQALVPQLAVALAQGRTVLLAYG